MEAIKFEDLNLDAKILRAVTDMGFEAASPIQGQSIPLELEGLDIIGQAQTGTGKMCIRDRLMTGRSRAILASGTGAVSSVFPMRSARMSPASWM